MKVKTLLASLAVILLLASCDPNADKQVGNNGRFGNSGSTSGSGSTGVGAVGSGGSTQADAPIDGGLGILLLAGTAYGVRRVRGARSTQEKK